MTDISSLSPAVQAQAAQAALSATDTSVQRVEASTPQLPLASYYPMIGQFIVIFAGGFLMQRGIDVSAWTGEQWGIVLGTIVTVGGAVMTWGRDFLRARREHQIALASAAASASATQATGRAVEVPVQPPPSKV